MKKILVSSLKFGQLGNRLFFQAHSIAYCLENKTPLIVANFYDYSNLFSLERKFDSIYFIKNPIIGNLINLPSKLVFRISNFSKKSEFLSVSEYVNRKNMPVIFLNKWNLNENELVKKHYSKIIEILKFKKEFYLEAEKRMNEIIGAQNKVLIGIHIRRTDYKTWKNGKYYYSLDQYSILMNKLSEIRSDVHFIICSDEKLERKKFNIPSDKLSISNCSFVADLIVLSKCNYILGPPSTFSTWASFTGKVPLYTVKDPNQEFKFNDFIPNSGDIYNLTR